MARWSSPGRRRLALSFDLALAGISAWVAMSLTLEALFAAPFDRSLRPVVLSLAAAHGGVLVFRRSWPVVVHAAVLGTGLLYATTGLPAIFLGPAVLVSIFTVAQLRSRLTGIAALAAAELTLVAGWAASGLRLNVSTGVAFIALMIVGAWALGAGHRHLQMTAAEQRARADQLEQARHELARLAVTTERVRIARELHDVLAHGMTLIAVLAGSGRLTIDTDPPAARSVLEAIERTARRSVVEMRRLLGALRQEGDAPDSLAPAPGLDDLGHLMEEFAASGLPVSLRIDGDLGAVPPGQSLAVYRIVQEALTTALKHAGTVPATVHLTVGPDEIGVAVRNGAGRPLVSTGADGQGMIGIRERVSLYGGHSSAGPTADGGWMVSATLPTERVEDPAP